jgi:hypothetical protein
MWSGADHLHQRCVVADHFHQRCVGGGDRGIIPFQSAQSF